jgi:hypothetical protein
MKNLILSFVFLLSTLTATAQVSSVFFEGKDAFKSVFHDLLLLTSIL